MCEQSFELVGSVVLLSYHTGGVDGVRELNLCGGVGGGADVLRWHERAKCQRLWSGSPRVKGVVSQPTRSFAAVSHEQDAGRLPTRVPRGGGASLEI